MNKILTQGQLNYLKDLEIYFYTSVKANYKRGTTREQTLKCFDVLDQVEGKKTSRNYTCGTCVLNAFKKLGQMYFDSIEYYKTQEAQETTQEEPKEEEVDTNTTEEKITEEKPKKKAGRPKKNSK